MKIASWNVNSIKARIDSSTKWIESASPDILMLQEVKCEEDAFPHDSFSHLPYNYAISGQKTYNGVAILAKYKIDEIKKDFPNNPCPEQARFIEASMDSPIGYLRAINVYVPNGGEVGSDKFELKFKFFEALTNYLESIKNYDENIVIGGDFNIAPFNIDVYSPKDLENSTCFTLGERQIFRKLLNNGWIDLFRLKNNDLQEYSWWDYRAGAFQKDHGMRIDFLLGNSTLSNFLKNAFIDKEPRSNQKPSDHTPVIIETE